MQSCCPLDAERPVSFIVVAAAVLAARDPEWFEKIDKLTPADMVALAEEFTKQQVAKVQHGEQQLMKTRTALCSAGEIARVYQFGCRVTCALP